MVYLMVFSTWAQGVGAVDIPSSPSEAVDTSVKGPKKQTPSGGGGGCNRKHIIDKFIPNFGPAPWRPRSPPPWGSERAHV